MNQGPSPGLPVVKDKLETSIAQMTVGTHPVTPRSRGRAPKVLQDDFSPDKELAAIVMSLEEMPRKRPRSETEALKTCARCLDCEAFISDLKTTGLGCPGRTLAVRANALRLEWKLGDYQRCPSCPDWDTLLWFLDEALTGEK